MKPKTRFLLPHRGDKRPTMLVTKFFCCTYGNEEILSLITILIFGTPAIQILFMVCAED